MAFHLEQLTLLNTDYRRVLSTNQLTQLVLMPVQGEIPWEIHEETEQFIRVEAGRAKIEMARDSENVSFLLEDGDSVTIPMGTWHRVSNQSRKGPVKLYTIYSPPHHRPGLVQKEEVEEVED